jgi:hypothetical protein
MDVPSRSAPQEREVMSDKSILQHITELVDEEHKLRDGKAAAQNETRLKQVEVELDQCWDLLRQRRARREFGQDPENATPRDPGTVENYEG